MDLVCDGAQLAELSQTLVILGQAFGAALFTSLADKYGRRTIHIIGHIGMLVSSFGLAFSTNYIAFAILRFFVGAFQQGAGLTLAILILETLPKEARYIGEGSGLIFWSIGVMLLTPFGYFLRNYSWKYLQMALALFSWYSLIEYWLMEESLRWLIANKRLKDAERIIRKASKMNKVSFEDVIKKATEKAQEFNEMMPQAHTDTTPQLDEDGNYVMKSTTPDVLPRSVSESTDKSKVIPSEEVKIEKYSVITIFKHKRILINSLVVWYAWFVNSLVYYGLTLMSSSLSGNRFLNHLLLGVVEIPAALTQISIVNRIGRKWTCIVFHSITAIALVVSSVLTVTMDNNSIAATLSLIFFLVGKYGVAGSFSTIFLYTPELYPTNLRNAGLGVASSIARVGGMLAPFAGPLAEHVRWGPGIICAVLCFITVCLVYFLPETMGHELPTTIKELKLWYKKHSKMNKGKR